MSIPEDVIVLRERLKASASDAAYPLWWTVGADHAKGGFFERLDMEAQPVDGVRRGRVLGLTFKPNTDDMRDAASLDIILALQTLPAKVKAFDQEGAEEAAHLLKDIDLKAGAYEARRRRRRSGCPNRVVSVPDTGSGSPEDAAEFANGGRSAQDLQARRNGPARLHLCQNRARLRRGTRIV